MRHRGAPPGRTAPLSLCISVTPVPSFPTQTDPTAYSAADQAHMQLALDLAEQAIGLTEPNPRVGCVIATPQGQVLGSGHTQQAGGPHAEVMALRAARESAGDAALRGATAYVTLEPCAHHGRTPPCADALLAAGIARVVASLRDPFPQVAGQGLVRLAAAGVRVELGLGAARAQEQNLGFFSRVLRGRPWVRLKIAASLDGLTALPNGRSQWITGPDARRDGHAWRQRAGAVLTGIGTVRDDDPRLDVRLVPSPRQPLRVLLDSGLAVDASARLLQPPGDVLVYTAAAPACDPGFDPARIQVIPAPPPDSVADDQARTRVHLDSVLADLAQRGVNELHVEAGYTLNGAFIAADLVDELLLYLAPKLLGQGRGLASFGPLVTLDGAPQLDFQRIDRIGDDLRVLARPRGRLAGWLTDAA
ncbi:riboflavin biosynthesis protein RibD [Sphaerotilus microaerophilus]|uniref:Riboflavin biosynthesis protein RibD n=2 Tax=Sphaerotilus microaerophilus TaxID=2914710 RepID=A0ABM7YR65_9BURK|nr:riboflavin biosynthesis protein RibD [Sphaerotilus sp. FB-5]